MTEIYPNTQESASFAVAVVKSNSGINRLEDLREKRSCHTGFGRTAGTAFTKVVNKLFNIFVTLHVTLKKKKKKAGIFPFLRFHNANSSIHSDADSVGQSANFSANLVFPVPKTLSTTSLETILCLCVACALAIKH